MAEGTGTPRLPGKVRRRQIVQMTLGLIAEEGIQGATMARIADAVGITEPSLYSHFASRQEILVAALDLVYERVKDITQAATDPDALERLRQMGRYHSMLVAAEDPQYLYPLFEFIAAPPNTGLREALGARQMMPLEHVATTVDMAKAQGTIREDIDSMELAGMIIGCSWAEGVAHLMGIADRWDASCWARMLDLLLASVATGKRPVPGGGERIV
ncbi:MAG TPA: TetR/AcrR family transcriptional regulator, partial [Thermoleophilia bacterium]|nr:TetR/AcrR family transcriptional regulator [Thermoleophilia bacterium]